MPRVDKIFVIKTNEIKIKAVFMTAFFSYTEIFTYNNNR